jgi:hypothetical protein
VESWVVQLLTIFGVAVGAAGSFASTRLLDRARWRREEAHRWDAKRLECYGAFAASIKDFLTLSLRISSGLGLPSPAQVLDAAVGLPLLIAAETDLGVKWESVLMLGSPEVIAAARDWRHCAWHLEWFARGLRQDAEEFSQAHIDSGAARNRFYSAVRDDLGIASGPIPELGVPLPWWQSDDSPPDTVST